MGARRRLGWWSAAAVLASLALLAPAARAGDRAEPPAAAEPEELVADGPRAEPAHAAKQVLLLHTFILGETTAKSSTRDAERAARLDKILTDAAQDLGFTLDVSDAAVDRAEELSDLELLARTRGEEWVVYPSIDLRSSDAVVRVAAAAPGSKVVNVRTEVVKAGDLSVRAVVMLRDVLASRPSDGAAGIETRASERAAPPVFVAPAHSQGRAILALNGALLGAFMGFSVQRSSGSDDPRLLYPLMALGTGIGLGASAIVTEEWDVALGEAWYLSAGAWWPALAGWYLARGSGDVANSTAYGTSILAAFAGLGVTTVALSLHHGMSEGGALLAHSGGAFGTGLGALAEFAIRGTTQGATPEQGIGYGALSGVLLAGALATQIDVEPSRVLAVDLGAGLGGLAGAAAASPFIFGDRTPSGDRAFLIATMGGTVAGGVLSWLWSRRGPSPKAAAPLVLGFAGPLPPPSFERSPLPAARDPLVLGAGVVGVLR